MQPSSVKHVSISNDPVWFFLAEYPLGQLMPDGRKVDGLAAGSFCQTLRELGIPPEWVENIELTLTRFARQALAQFEPERLGMPERLRVFCQKKMLDEKMNGGWGFFLLERTDGSPESPSASSQSCVDLYIYREGE